MTALVNDEDSYGECGEWASTSITGRSSLCTVVVVLLYSYDVMSQWTPSLLLLSHSDTILNYATPILTGYYLATLEAATQHIFDLADQYTAELAQSAEGRSLEEASGEEALLDGAFEEKLLLH